MHVQTIVRLTTPATIDFTAAGAAMRLAWVRTAQALWSARQFGTDHRDLFAKQLRAAHAHVAQVRLSQRKAAAAAKDQRVVSLREEREVLYFQPFGMHIGQRVSQIDAEIAAITNSMG